MNIKELCVNCRRIRHTNNNERCNVCETLIQCSGRKRAMRILGMIESTLHNTSANATIVQNQPIHAKVENA